MRNTVVKGSLGLIWICFWLLAGCASRQSASMPGGIRITSNPRYDEKIAQRILKNWYESLDNPALEFSTGKVKVSFVLHSDGTVSDVKITANNAGYVPGWVCVEAILKSAPFPKWSSEMVAKLGDHCDAEFTFDYRR